MADSTSLNVGNNGALTYKDIFSIPNSVCIHVCNVKGGFGRGFAAAINQRFPEVRSDYMKRYRENRLQLGTNSVHNVSPNKFIVNMYAMPDYRRSSTDKRCYLDYDALEDCLEAVANYVKQCNRLITLPYLMGAGNAGGDWSRIVTLLDQYLEFYVVCKLKE